MAYTVIPPSEQSFGHPRGHPDEEGRTVLRVRDYVALTHSQASLWRYPPHTRGRRHQHYVQEEVFLVLQGEFSALLGDPGERKELPEGSILIVEAMTPLQLFNNGDEEGVLFIYGAPADGSAAYLDEVS